MRFPWGRKPLTAPAPVQPRCSVCGAAATQFKALPPWPGSSYAHTSYACNDHLSYLHGHSWASTARTVDGVTTYTYTDMGLPRRTCATCDGEYGNCGCPSRAVAKNALKWEAEAEFGSVSEGWK